MRLRAEVSGFAERLDTDEQFRNRLDGIAADVAVFAIDRYGHELTAVITRTIERWDGKEAARRSSCTWPGPAVHPDQRHDRGRPGGCADPRGQRAASLNP